MGALTLLTLAACQDTVLPSAPHRLAPTIPLLTLTGASGIPIFPTRPPDQAQASGSALGLNNSGQVTGTVIGLGLFGNDDYISYRWTPGAGIVVLVSPNTTRGNDINDAGVLAGTSNGIEARAFRASGTTMTFLSDLPGGSPPDQDAAATAINASGQVVGWGSTPKGSARHAVLWSSTGVIQDLGTLGGSNSAAIDINASGQVIGTSQIAGNAATHFFLWSPHTGMQDLSVQLGTLTSLVEINDVGQIAGTYATPGGASHAFRYTPGSGLLDLGTLGGTFSSATGLNSSGQVVGSSALADGTMRAFLWTPTDGMEDITAIAGVTQVLRLNENLQTLTGPASGSKPRLIQLTVTPNGAPVARFTYSCTGSTCTLDATSSSDDQGVVSYAWDLNKFPGGSATGPTVSVTYPHAGPRNVKLTVSDANGLKGSVTQTINIGAPPIQPPTVLFYASCSGLTCAFNSSTSPTSIIGDGLVRAWSFGDGTSAGNVYIARHTFASAGTYSVVLTGTDGGGLSNSFAMKVTVTAPSPQPAVARIIYSCAGTTCTFDGTTSSGEKGIVSYAWDLNTFPGGSASGATATATYPHSGTRNVTLTVKDASGQSNSSTRAILIP